MLLCLIGLWAAGCSYHDGYGTRHTLILGFGIVSVNSTNKNLATVTKITGIGFNGNTSPARGGIGYFNSTTVEVKCNTNLAIEIDQKPGSPILVDVQ